VRDLVAGATWCERRLERHDFVAIDLSTLGSTSRATDGSPSTTRLRKTSSTLAT
jgi:hypothetical protein